MGSGDFACPVKCVAYFSGVSETLQQAEVKFEKKYLPKRPIEELIEIVAGKMGVKLYADLRPPCPVKPSFFCFTGVTSDLWFLSGC